jgi:HK97 family phage portal protein
MDISELFKKQERSSLLSISDSALIEWLGIGVNTAAGYSVTESSSLGLTAVYRAVALIAGTLAALPLKSYRRNADDTRDRVFSLLDDPGGYLTVFEWKEMIYTHLLLHGNAYLLHQYNGAGVLSGLQPIHPSAVSVTLDSFGKTFKVSLKQGGVKEFNQSQMTQLMNFSVDGVYGISPITACRSALATGLAADEAAGKMFANGLLLGGVVTGDFTEEQAAQIKAGFNRVQGSKNAGDISVLNRAVDFKPWAMNAEDAQFIEGRSFQVEEVARIFGVPKVLLAEDGGSTWGAGIKELIRGMHTTVFLPWAKRVEERLTRLLPRGQYAEFDFAQLLEPTKEEVTANLIAETDAGILTINEARKILNRPPLPESEEPKLEEDITEKEQTE